MKLIFFALFSALVFAGNAQVTGQNESYLLSGVVADSTNNPLNDALVTLYLFNDSTTITSALTAVDGGFVINITNPEKYFLSIAALGYQSYFSQVIEVTSLKTKYVLPIINLKATGSLQLESVEIISKKPFVEQSIDRIIVLGAPPILFQRGGICRYPKSGCNKARVAASVSCFFPNPGSAPCATASAWCSGKLVISITGVAASAGSALIAWMISSPSL